MLNKLERWKQRQEIIRQLMDAALRVQDAITDDKHFESAVAEWEKLKLLLDES